MTQTTRTLKDYRPQHDDGCAVQICAGCKLSKPIHFDQQRLVKRGARSRLHKFVAMPCTCGLDTPLASSSQTVEEAKTCATCDFQHPLYENCTHPHISIRFIDHGLTADKFGCALHVRAAPLASSSGLQDDEKDHGAELAAVDVDTTVVQTPQLPHDAPKSRCCSARIEDAGECSDGCCDRYRCTACGRTWLVEVPQ